MLAKSFTEDVQFGGFYNIRKFTSALDNNKETLELLFKNKDDIIKLEKLKTTLGFAQGRISDISGVPGGVLIQLKQAGAAGQLLQYGGGLLSPANVAVGGAAAAGRCSQRMVRRPPARRATSSLGSAIGSLQWLAGARLRSLQGAGLIESPAGCCGTA